MTLDEIKAHKRHADEIRLIVADEEWLLTCGPQTDADRARLIELLDRARLSLLEAEPPKVWAVERRAEWFLQRGELLREIEGETK